MKTCRRNRKKNVFLHNFCENVNFFNEDLLLAFKCKNKNLSDSIAKKTVFLQKFCSCF